MTPRWTVAGWPVRVRRHRHPLADQTLDATDLAALDIMIDRYSHKLVAMLLGSTVDTIRRARAGIRLRPATIARLRDAIERRRRAHVVDCGGPH